MVLAQIMRRKSTNICLSDFTIFEKNLEKISLSAKTIISTLNAHSFNMSQTHYFFKQALKESDIILPDGISIVWGMKFLYGVKIKKIAGADIFQYLISEMNKCGGKCFFLGSTIDTLKKIKSRLNNEYSNIIIEYYSPPYKPEFSQDENETILERINNFKPDILFVGMTAPKQEMWVHMHKRQINSNIICSIGAVFDFYASTTKRAPDWMIYLGLEWFFRLIMEPRRMWKRYLVGNSIFIWLVLKEKLRQMLKS